MRTGLSWCPVFDGPQSVGLVKVSLIIHPFFSSQTILVTVPETHFIPAYCEATGYTVFLA